MYNDPSGLCPECPNASDFNVGDTHDINGVTYVVDNDGQWAREGGIIRRSYNKFWRITQNLQEIELI
ncbi:hypothetical protein [Aquimarina sp. EL_43]|uniref:hypothetical protein n=1 Tax=Aquimarina sp. EL_43 TaxID=2787736 RepID=UPI0020C4E742|nr:hypothetical protein [Aquimarina sp. EL_43]